MVKLATLVAATAVVVLAYQPDVRSLSREVPPSLPPSVAARNLQPFTDQPWQQLIGNFWNYLRRSSSKDADIVADATAPFSPPNVLRIVFSPSLENDRQPTVHWIGLPFCQRSACDLDRCRPTGLRARPEGKDDVSAPARQRRALQRHRRFKPPHRINIVTTWPHYGYKFWEPNVAITDVSYDRWYRVECMSNGSRARGGRRRDPMVGGWNAQRRLHQRAFRSAACCSSSSRRPCRSAARGAGKYIDHTWIATHDISTMHRTAAAGVIAGACEQAAEKAVVDVAAAAASPWHAESRHSPR